MSQPGLLRNASIALACLLLLISAVSGVRSLYIYCKAQAAQILMARAWSESMQTKQPVKAWNWADTRVSARLEYQISKGAQRQSLFVLDNASGEAMAFGPGLLTGRLDNTSNSTVAIGGHRDTHLAFLEYANAHTVFILHTVDGNIQRYQYTDAFIADTRNDQLLVAQNQPGLVLITCYPFNASQTGGPLRMVVRAHPLDI